MADEAEAVAVRVADGEDVDWDGALKRASDDRERRVLRHLRLVESISRVHRSGEVELTETLGPPLPRTRSWGPLELREKLGQGAFGEVYRAFDPRLEREVALKLLQAGRPEGSSVVEEARLLAKLRHPNVVTVHGAEVHEGRVGLWMELIRGRSLEQLLREQGPSGAREAALIGIDLCRALAAVHGAGVVHRDVKAENAMREEGGRILLTDFGAGVEVRGGAGDRERTLSGTPFYMAPELFRGEPASPRSDLYALGVLLYRLVTGTFPVQAATWRELRDKHAKGESTLLRDRRPDLPEPFVAAVERATSGNPAERFATAGQMEQALQAALGSAAARVEAVGSRRPLWLPTAALVAVAAVAVAGVVVLWPEPAPLAPTPATAPPGTALTYTVEAALHRVPAGGGARERLAPGAQLSLRDELTLEFEASAPLYVYVVNEDEAGRAYALFPLPDLMAENPLAPGVRHVLPGARRGESTRLSWVVDTPGGREHLIVLASPARLVEFEAEMNALARPGAAAVAIPESARVRLRGIGGLAESKAPEPPGPGARHLFEMAERLASRSEMTQGVWMRQIELASPPP